MNTQPATKTYPIPSALIHELLQYLQTKPWHEANPFIAAFMQIIQGDQPPQNIVMPDTKGNGRESTARPTTQAS